MQPLHACQLQTGEFMGVARVCPPMDTWGEAIVDFIYLRHPQYTNCSWHHHCIRLVRGDFADASHDVFLVGLIDGSIAGTVWYTTPRDFAKLGTLGRVLTAQEHRRKGISSILCRMVLDEFTEQGGLCMQLGTGTTNPAHRIYRRLGFADCCTEAGGGTIMRAIVHGDAGEFDRHYFAPGHPVHLRPLNWGDLPHVELLINLHHWLLKDTTQRVYANTPVEGQFYDIMTALELQQEEGFVLQTDEGHMVGFAYPAVTGAGAGVQEHARVIEFVIHPHYVSHGKELLVAVMGASRGELFLSYSTDYDGDRCAVLVSADFQRQGILPGFLRIDGQSRDLYTYTKSLN